MADIGLASKSAALPQSKASSAARDAILTLKSRIGKSVLGQDHLVESMLMGLLASGNLLIESFSKRWPKILPPICRACSSRRSSAFRRDRCGNLRADGKRRAVSIPERAAAVRAVVAAGKSRCLETGCGRPRIGSRISSYRD